MKEKLMQRIKVLNISGWTEYASFCARLHMVPLPLRNKFMPYDAARCRAMQCNAVRCRSMPFDAARCRAMLRDAA
jgi:hypothetical protein